MINIVEGKENDIGITGVADPWRKVDDRPDIGHKLSINKLDAEKYERKRCKLNSDFYNVVNGVFTQYGT